MRVSTELRIIPVKGIDEIAPGTDLGLIIYEAIGAQQLTIQQGDVLVVTQKIVSKAEGNVVNLDEISPSQFAQSLALESQKDASHIEVILGESRRIVRMDHGVLISETRHGFVCANAGVDASNVPLGWVTVLPREPDASADRLREALSEAFECPIGVIVADTFGRPWREGLVNVALGVAGLRPLIDYRGCVDPYGRQLEITVVALADEIAGADEIVMHKTAGTPVAIVRGAAEWAGPGSAQMLVRDAAHDLFR